MAIIETKDFSCLEKTLWGRVILLRINWSSSVVPGIFKVREISVELNYSIARNLDRIASLLRTIGLSSITRLCRDLISRMFKEGITIKVGGSRLCGSIRDRAFVYKVGEGYFEPQTVKAFLEALKPGMVVMDIGAYLGYYTIFAAEKVGPSGKVYAFEPDPQNYSLLEHNIRINGYKNVVAIRKAVSNKTGTLKFYQHSYDPSMGSLIFRKGCQRVVNVDCVSVDEFLVNHQVDIIKMDVEGSEVFALQGMLRTIGDSPGLTLFVELNPGALMEAKSSSQELLNKLKRLGFDNVIQIDRDDKVNGELVLCNLFCRRGLK